VFVCVCVCVCVCLCMRVCVNIWACVCAYNKYALRHIYRWRTFRENALQEREIDRQNERASARGKDNMCVYVYVNTYVHTYVYLSAPTLHMLRCL